jgi:DNA-binding MarR family transcriptional regulator
MPKNDDTIMRVITRMSEHNPSRLDTSEFGACACTQVRRTARKVSLFYDAVLSAAGLSVTQYALLVNIARAGELSRTALALKLGMERTTLTRNLRRLELEKLVTTLTGKDRREQLIRLSAAGRKKLKAALPLWEKAQQTFISHIGPDALRELRAMLTAAELAAQNASNSIKG